MGRTRGAAPLEPGRTWTWTWTRRAPLLLPLLGVLFRARAEGQPLEGSVQESALGTLPHVLSNAPWIQAETPTVLSYEEIVNIRFRQSPAFVPGFWNHSQAKQWKAWEAWTAEELERKDGDYYFSEMELHKIGESVSYNGHEGSPDALRQSKKKKNGYRIVLGNMLFSEFLSRCDSGDLLYTGGSEHPLLDEDIQPLSEFGFKGMPPWVPYYWACPKVCDYLHYDWQGVLLVQVSGEKDVLIIDPKHYDSLHLFPTLHKVNRYTRMKLCPAPERQPIDVKEFPKLRNIDSIYSVRMRPGDALWIPAFWHHSVGIPDGVRISTSVALKDPINLDMRHELPLFSLAIKMGETINIHPKGQNPIGAYVEVIRLLIQKAIPSSSWEKDVRGSFMPAALERLLPVSSTQNRNKYDCSAIDPANSSPKDIKVIHDYFETKNFTGFQNIYEPVIWTLLRHEVDSILSATIGPLNLLSFYQAVIECSLSFTEGKINADDEEKSCTADSEKVCS